MNSLHHFTPFAPEGGVGLGDAEVGIVEGLDGPNVLPVAIEQVGLHLRGGGEAREGEKARITPSHAGQRDTNMLSFPELSLSILVSPD